MRPNERITSEDIERDIQSSDGLMLVVVALAVVGGLFMLGVAALLGAL